MTDPALPRSAPPRVVVESVHPEVDAGRFPVKRIVGDVLEVSADVFTEGHDRVSATLRWREPGGEWRERPMSPLGNDRFAGACTLTSTGLWEYTVEAWVDRFGTWRSGLARKVEARQDVELELAEGAVLLEAVADRAPAAAAAGLRTASRAIADDRPQAARVKDALSDTLQADAALAPERSNPTTYAPVLVVEVERERAGCGAWYEFFPRSASPEPGRHGTLADASARLNYVAEMGFDVVYLPPIHPIGRAFRKGPNN
ncbi:MAG: maltotransferase domain-containing protein, partial [Gemmatimonadales bacterium]